MTSRQGSMDCLCGVYAVINATEIVIGKFIAHSKTHEQGQKRRLFNELIGYLAKKNKLERALTEGISKINTHGGLLDIAVKSVKTYQKLRMRKQRAFDDDEQTLEYFWVRLTEHLSQDGTAVIICISGKTEHWTCVKKVTDELLILANSSFTSHIHRNKCMIGSEKIGMYTLWPTLTYLLSIENKSAQ